MKISIDVDITPEELRSFIGLPNVEKIQDEMILRAQEWIKESGQTQYQDLIQTAIQPMMAYQSWLQKMMSPNGTNGEKNEG